MNIDTRIEVSIEDSRNLVQLIRKDLDKMCTELEEKDDEPLEMQAFCAFLNLNSEMGDSQINYMALNFKFLKAAFKTIISRDNS